MQIERPLEARMYRSRRWRFRFQWLAVGLAMFTLWSCQSVRGVMYMHKPRVGDYLAKTAKQNFKGDLQQWEKRRKLLADIPDGNRILGGFCADDAEIKAALVALRKLEKPCNTRMVRYARDANTQGGWFWGLLLSSVGTGIGMIAVGVAPIDDVNAKAITTTIFGATTVVLALVNGLGGFDGRQTVLNMRAKKIDNLMWTMRLRFLAEVCNAKSRAVARQQARQIVHMTRALCVTQSDDDGFYRIPHRSQK